MLRFIEQDVYPVEKELTQDKVGSRRGEIMKGLMDKAKSEGLWALGHPEEIGGGWITLYGLCLYQRSGGPK